jgi:hypothetical protein
MTEVKAYECNGCGKLVKWTEAHVIKLEADKYWTGPGNNDYGQSVIDLHFCSTCAWHIKDTLDQILKRMDTHG